LQKLRSLAISDDAISSITQAELEYGVAKSSRPEQNTEALQGVVASLEFLPFDDDAACASSLACTLVSNNLREFEGVPGLWSVLNGNGSPIATTFVRG